MERTAEKVQYKLDFTYTLNPTLHVGEVLRDEVTKKLLGDGSPLHFTGLKALQRHHQWAIEFPLGVFLNNYTPGAVTPAEDLQARTALMANLNPLKYRGRDIVLRDGTVFYRKPFIARFAEVTPDWAMPRALLAFLVAAEADHRVIKGAASRLPHRTAEERLERFGRLTRGPGWTDAEDQVLKRWFAKRTVGDMAGKHAPLTEEEWANVFQELKGLRTYSSVQQRLVKLNDDRRKAYTARGIIVDGYIAADALREYMDGALGEKPRKPKIQPRRKASSRRHNVPAPRHIA